MPMDVAWALDELRKFETMTVMTNASGGGLITTRSKTANSDSEVASAAPIVEQILDRVIPNWRRDVPLRDSNRWTRHPEATQRAMTLLEREAELRERLGDRAPIIDASQLHSWVWDGARSMWQSGHYSQGVVDALKKVNAEAQNKSGRHDIGESDLFKQLFTIDSPKPGAPRLRLMPDDGSATFKNVHRGAWALAEGLFAGVRNVLSHTVLESEKDEQRAVEQLAAVSVLARWVDEAQLENIG